MKIVKSPDYVDELIIYELSTRGFTSPQGAESGTFSSLEEKLDYLEELGVNAIWLTGHQLCDSKHFYNIWTEYACIRPDRIDPVLGSEESFKHLIENAHKHGMRVFLDVITHGVMSSSPLVQEHPDWFKGGSWGMSDFDWYGGHDDLDRWWVDTWLRYVTEFGIDGFRLDVAHYRCDLWALLRKEAEEAGRPIFIMVENGPAVTGVADALQHGELVSNNPGINKSTRLLRDVGGYCRDRLMRVNENYSVMLFYDDGTVQDSRKTGWFEEELTPEAIYEGETSEEIVNEKLGSAYVMQKGRLRVENIYVEKNLTNVRVMDKNGQEWNSNGEGNGDYFLDYRKTANGIITEFPLRSQDGVSVAIQLSCHDNGWEGYSPDESPYAANGSRYIAGYTSLLAPGIPIFMSGEEFNADYRPLPQLTDSLYGDSEPGKGRWLYGIWIDWTQLEKPEKADMLADFKEMIKIRKEYSSMIRPGHMGEEADSFMPLGYISDDVLPVPYVYLGDDTFLVVAANPDKDKDTDLQFCFTELLDGNKKYSASVLFGKDCSEVNDMSAGELSQKKWKITKDCVKGGGLLVIKIQEN